MICQAITNRGLSVLTVLQELESLGLYASSDLQDGVINNLQPFKSLEVLSLFSFQLL